MAKKTAEVTQAQAWWDNLSWGEQNSYTSSFNDPNNPTSAELAAAYKKAHPAAGVAGQSQQQPGEKAPTTPTKAKDWWRDLPPRERETFKDKFQNINSPTPDELIKVYDEAHNEPPTPERAKAWWEGLGLEDQRVLRAKYLDQPADDELVTLYEKAHQTALDVEVQHTGEEPPEALPATPYASATNPELMKNDVEAGPDVPLYDRQRIPEEVQEQIRYSAELPAPHSPAQQPAQGA